MNQHFKPKFHTQISVIYAGIFSTMYYFPHKIQIPTYYYIFHNNSVSPNPSSNYLYHTDAYTQFKFRGLILLLLLNIHKYKILRPFFPHPIKKLQLLNLFNKTLLKSICMYAVRTTVECRIHPIESNQIKSKRNRIFYSIHIRSNETKNQFNTNPKAIANLFPIYSHHI